MIWKCFLLPTASSCVTKPRLPLQQIPIMDHYNTETEVEGGLISFHWIGLDFSLTGSRVSAFMHHYAN